MSNLILPHSIRELRFPWGRIAVTKDKGDAGIFGTAAFSSHLGAKVFRANGSTKNYDLGSGLTTQSLALALINQGISANNTGNTLGLLKYMASGTGVTAATAYDYQLQTVDANTTQANGVTTAITPTLSTSADNATMQFVGTLNYNANAQAITEWGLFAGTGVLVPTGWTNTAADAFTATTFTPTASQTWTANAYAGQFVLQVAAATSTVGLVTSNTATALTVGPTWVNQTAGGGLATTPSANTASVLVPLMADHKVFAAVNVNSGDSIQFTYTLTVQSGN